MAQESENTGKLIWFVAGAALGAALALLYTPVSGRELRRKIREKAEEGGSAVAERGRELYEKGRDLFERGRKLVES